MMLNSDSELDDNTINTQIDYFDPVPDPLLLLIFNNISDIKTLIRCRAVSKRFNSIIPQSDSLLLRVDRVISVTESDDDDEDDPFILTFLRSIFKSLHDLVSAKPLPIPTRSIQSPTEILRSFERIRDLEIELPSGDLRLEKGTVLRWKAEFGRSLKSCVILGFGGGGGGLKMRVVWTISALIAASARHYMVKEVVREHQSMVRLVVRDREGEGIVVMDKDSLMENREFVGEEEVVGDGVMWSGRTTVPAVRMRMRHVARVELDGGVSIDGATLVVVRPMSEPEEVTSDAVLANGAFDGVYAQVVRNLMKSPSYLLEMNSF